MVDRILEEKIDRYIEEHKAELEEDIFSLVRIRSVSEKDGGGYPFGKGCHDVLEKALKKAEKFGLRVHNCENRCGYAEYGNESGRKIGIFSHLDVVPEGEGWEYEPYSPVEKDGFLIGRGVADNKGAATYSLYALRFLKENGIKLSHNILLYFGLSEETGMEDIEYFTQNYPVPYFSIVPDSNFPVCYGEKGIMRFSFAFTLPLHSALEDAEGGLVVNSIPAKATAVISSDANGGESGISIEVKDKKTFVTASGKAAHAAFPEGSVNALNVLSSFISKNASVDDETRRIFSLIAVLTSSYDGTPLGVKMKDSQSGALTVSGTLLRKKGNTLTLSFDMRYPVTVRDSEPIITRLKKKAEEMGAVFILDSNSKGTYTPLDSPEVRKLCEVACYVHKRELQPYTMGGGTYSRMLPFAVGFGPGLPDAPNLFPSGRGNGHQADECISFELLLKGLKAEIIALIELDKIIS